MKTAKLKGSSESGGTGLEPENRASLAARWRSLSAWITGELANMRNERLDRGFMATSHGKNYRSPDPDQPATPGAKVEGDPDR